MPLLLSSSSEWPGRKNTSYFVASQQALNTWGCPSGKPTSHTHSYTKETAPGTVQATVQAQGHFKIQQSTTSDPRASEPWLFSGARERMSDNTFALIHVVFRFSSVINSHSSLRTFFSPFNFLLPKLRIYDISHLQWLYSKLQLVAEIRSMMGLFPL